MSRIAKRSTAVLAATMVSLLAPPAIANAGPSPNGSFVEVIQYGHVTHTVCAGHAFKLFGAETTDQLALIYFDIELVGTGHVYSSYVLLGGGDGGAGHKLIHANTFSPGKYLLKFDVTVFDEPEKGSVSFTVRDC